MDKIFCLEAETAITQLPTHEQDHIRYQVAHNITHLYKQQEEKHTKSTTHIKMRKIP
jgi:ribosomal protein S17E